MRRRTLVRPDALEPLLLLSDAVITIPGLDPDPPVRVSLISDAGSAGRSTVPAEGATAHRLAVKFSGTSPVDESTVVGNHDAFVVTRSGVAVTPLRYVDRTMLGGHLVAVYEFTPPGGAWDWTDNGTYTVSLRGGEVRTLAGEWGGDVTAGSFDVHLPGALARYRGAEDAQFFGRVRTRRSPQPFAFEVAFDAPRQGEFDVIASFGEGYLMRGTARLRGTKLVLKAEGMTLLDRRRVLRLAGRMDASGAITGRWTHRFVNTSRLRNVPPNGSPPRGTFWLTRGPAHNLMRQGGEPEGVTWPSP